MQMSIPITVSNSGISVISTGTVPIMFEIPKNSSSDYPNYVRVCVTSDTLNMNIRFGADPTSNVTQNDTIVSDIPTVFNVGGCKYGWLRVGPGQSAANAWVNIVPLDW